jgi:hypothetical protein
MTTVRRADRHGRYPRGQDHGTFASAGVRCRLPDLALPPPRSGMQHRSDCNNANLVATANPEENGDNLPGPTIRALRTPAGAMGCGALPPVRTAQILKCLRRLTSAGMPCNSTQSGDNAGARTGADGPATRMYFGYRRTPLSRDTTSRPNEKSKPAALIPLQRTRHG